MELYYEVHDGNGPYLLLMHGMLSSRAQWSSNLEALKQVARPVVAELWAHGRSPSPHDPASYHPDAYVEQFERLREKLGAERWFVCGQSFGASLTIRYAVRHPDRVIGQIFTNSNSAMADEAGVAAYRAAAKGRIDLVERQGLAGIEAIPVHPRHARRLPDDVKDELVQDAGSIDPGGLVMTFRYTSPHLSVHSLVPDNKVPALLVCGVRESKFLPSRDRAVERMPRLQVVEAEAGHAVNIQAADTFNEAVGEFLRRHVDDGEDR
jgi:pimeloyl-ACP methyl ester carboxylesterase